MPLLSWQLWLAKESIQDSPLPWQKFSVHLSPGRLAKQFATVLARIGTPEESSQTQRKASWLDSR